MTNRFNQCYIFIWCILRRHTKTIYHFVPFCFSFFFFFFLDAEQLNFSISRLVKTPDSDDEDNNNTYEHQNHHRIHHERNGKMSPHSELTSSCKDSCTKSRSRSSSRSRCASRSCSVSSPELEVDSPPPPPLPLRINDSPSTTNIFQVSAPQYDSQQNSFNSNIIILHYLECRKAIGNIFGVGTFTRRRSTANCKITHNKSII